MHKGGKNKSNEYDYEFKTQGQLTHMNSEYEEVKYYCNQCDSKFTLQSSLIQHIQLVHEEIYKSKQC